jgi:hypothetical protein
MDVRQARPTDAPLVLTLAIDRDAHLVRGTEGPDRAPLLRTLWRALLPLGSGLWIARDGGASALLEVRPRPYVIGWDITRLAVRRNRAREESGERSEVLGAVIAAAAEQAQRRGVPRLFVRCTDEALQALQRYDFRPIAHEYVLLGGSSSLEWSTPRRHSQEIVVERDGAIVGWIGWRTRPVGGLLPLGMVFHPDHDGAAELLAHAMGRLPAGARAIIRVREYQEEVVRVCLDAGFVVVAGETVAVKHGRLQFAEAPRRLHAARVPSFPVAPLQTGTGR